MKKLILVAGLPGVGKPTIARVIESRMGGVVLDVDDFKRKVVDPKEITQGVDPPEIRWIYYKAVLDHAIDLFQDGTMTVIVDEVFHIATLRHKIEAVCRENGIQVLWVEVCSLYSTVERRLRVKPREGHILTTEEALRMYCLFEEIFEPFNPGFENYFLLHNDDEASHEAVLARLSE